MPKSIKYILISIFLLIIYSCDDENKNANESLIGEWEVRSAAQVNGDNRMETRDSGTFKFSSEMVDYSFFVDTISYTSVSEWELNTEMVNQGFIKVPKYTLTIDGLADFDVQFGDMTDGAEENASSITLSQITDLEGVPFLYLELEKK